MSTTPPRGARVSCYRRGRSLVVIKIMMFLLATTISGSGLSHTVAIETLASDGSPVPVKSDNSTSGRHGSRRGRRELYHVDVTEAGQPCVPSPLLERKVDPANYELGCTEIEAMLEGDMTFLGQGFVRDVSSVEYQGTTVVVKTLRHMETKYESALLRMHNQEVLTLDVLAGHRNIVGMLGLCGTTVVTEFYPQTFMKSIFRKGKPLPIVKVVSMALNAARGLQALHELAGCLHMDLKPMQLLVDGSGHVKLNDFNSALMMSVNPTDGTYCPGQSPRRNRLTPWPSPENYAGEPVTQKSDIYSLGMIFFSLIAGNLPYNGDDGLLKTAFLGGARPEIDPSWHRGFMEVVQAMWAEDPKQRPSAGRVVARLEGIQEELGVSPSSS